MVFIFLEISYLKSKPQSIFCQKKYIPGLGYIEGWAKSLPGKHEGLSSNLQDLCKIQTKQESTSL